MRFLPVAVLCLLLSASPALAQKKALFDNTRAQTAGNADWVIDTEQPIPVPAQSGITWATPENYWTGASSAWAVQLVKRGFTVATLTSANGITYNNLTNPYDLSHYDIFIVDEPNVLFSAAESTAIFDYVRDGGGLFVVSDHNGSDRNNDGQDSPHIWNRLDAQQSWGVHFNVTGESNNSISQFSSNVNASPTDSIINGAAGVAPGIAYHSGTVMQLNTGANPSVAGDVWTSTSGQGTTNVMVAHSTYGNGRIVFVGDSSPADDGTGNPGDNLSPDWAEHADSLIFLNGSIWAARRNGALPDSVPPTVALTSPTGGEDWPIGSLHNITWTASDDMAVTSIDLHYSTDGGATFPNAIATGLANSGSYAWTISSLPGATVRVRVRAHDAGGNLGVDSSAANLQLSGWTVTATAGANGSIAPLGTVGYGDGATPSYTITPTGGYAVSDVLVNGGSVGALTSYNFAPIHADQTISASFVADGSTPTYTWNKTGSASWPGPANWTPARNAPSATDVLIFNGGGAVTATGIPTQTIAQLRVTGSTAVTLQCTGAQTLTLGGNLGSGLDLEAGSGMVLDGSSTLSLALGSGATGSIRGSVSLSGAAHRLFAAGTNALDFESGSMLTLGTGFSGNAFGTGIAPGALTSVRFKNGSLLAQSAGANPFGATAPNAVVTFQPGSRFRMDATLTPSVSGRNYADFEYNGPGSVTPTGGNPYSIDSLIITQGGFSLNSLSGGGTIKGNVQVKPGATLTFSPASLLTLTLGGTAPQAVRVQGTLATNVLSTLAINNSAGITLLSNVTVSGTVAFTAGRIATGGNTLALTTVGAITGASTASGWVDGNLKRPIPGGASTVAFAVGNIAGYAPVTLDMSGVGPSFDMTASSTGGDHPNLETSDLDPDKSVNRYWTLTPAASPTFSSCNATFNFPASDADGAASPAGFHVRRYSGTWDSTAVGTRLSNVTQAVGVTGFGDFAIGEIFVPTITASAGPNGSISPSGPVMVTLGGSQSFTITPSNGYVVDEVLVDGNSVGAVPTYNFTNVTSNRTIEASFKPDIAGAPDGRPAVLALLPARPNPSRGSAVLRFSLPHAGPVRLEILDIHGRMVWSETGSLSAGTHTRAWEGRLDDGRTAAAGLYLVRLTSPWGTRSGKLVRLQ